MSKLEQFQDFIRRNGKKITGEDVPVVLSNEEAKYPQLKFTFGWRIEIGVASHEHGPHCPSGVNCGRSASASDAAHKSAQDYVSGRNPLFNSRFKEELSSDVSKNFIIRNTDLRSAPDTFVGSDPCHSCNGSGQDTCYSCHGNGKSSCSSCNGSGRVSVSKFDSYNNRTVYTTESCSSCYGRGTQTCSTCGGCGNITCSTCNGGGNLYYSYTIDGDAKRSTEWAFESNDYHQWTSDYVKKTGLSLIHGMTEVTEVDVEGDLDGCTFIYAFTAKLPTLQFTATVDKVDTKMCFAGSQNRTHDAGGVYDPAVWSIAKKLGSGHQAQDKTALNTPAIKDILEANATNTSIALLDENWVSPAIKDAVVSNYQTLVTQLKKQSVKGIAPKMISGLVKYGYLLFMVGLLLALIFPDFAEQTDQRMGLTQYVIWFVSLLCADFGLFGLPPFANYAIVLGLFLISYHSIKKWYWKRISKTKTIILALAVTFFFPHIGFSVYYNALELVQHSPKLGNALLSGSIFAGIYLLIYGFKRPNKWYLKPLGLILAFVVYLAIQIGMSMLNDAVEIVSKDGNYFDHVFGLITPAIDFIALNIAELVVLSVCLSYFMTRRAFWLKAKTAVADYDSPVLLKSMNMEK
ncbi:MAG: hypothetical protein JKY74_04450 [Shewanella sp.]|nr:hypothetical protein [Shewanella sp.]